MRKDCEFGDSLVWYPEHGMGYSPVPARTYSGDYFADYVAKAATPMGEALTRARVELVARHWPGSLVDVGVGSGQFVTTRLDTSGYDVNPVAVRWLKERSLYSDMYAQLYPALSFWDALEHIPDPGAALCQAYWWAFVSLPVFESGEHVICSKHYKPGEHLWYWTRNGFARWAAAHGFVVREESDVETQLGREGICSFALERNR